MKRIFNKLHLSFTSLAFITLFPKMSKEMIRLMKKNRRLSKKNQNAIMELTQLAIRNQVLVKKIKHGINKFFRERQDEWMISEITSGSENYVKLTLKAGGPVLEKICQLLNRNEGEL